MFTPPFPAPIGFRWVFCPRVRHWRSGQWIYPKKAKVFMFLVRTKR